MTITKTYVAYEAADGDTDGGVSNFNVPVPVGADAGDTAIIALALRDDRGFNDYSAFGFDQLWETADTTTGVRLAVYVVTVTAADVTAGSWGPLTCSGGTSVWACSVVVYNGTVEIGGGAADAGNLTTPALTESLSTLADQATGILYVGAVRHTASVSFTPPAGFTERGDNSHNVDPVVATTIAELAEWTYGDVGPWTATVTAGTKQCAGYVVVFGQLGFTTPTLPDAPNDTLGFDVPFTDGIHRVWSGWSGGVLLAQANLGGSAFRLNDDTYGRLNSARLGPAEDGWVDLGADLLDISITAGGTQDDGVLTRMEAGTATLVLNDWDGNWDPLNESSPYRQDWRLGCRVRVHGNAIEQMAVHNPAADSVAYALFGLFTGRIESMVASGYADEDPIVTVNLVDDVALLAAADAPEQSAAGAGDDLEARVLRILANAGWEAGTLDADIAHPDWPTATYQATTLAQPAWTEILLCCDAGMVGPVIRGDGNLYLTPIAPNLDTYQAHKFGYAADEVAVVDVELAYDRDQLRNVVTVAEVGGTEQTFTDTASITRQGGRYDWSRTDLPLQSPTEVASLGRRILGFSSDPTPRVTAITVWPQIFGPGNYGDVELYLSGTLSQTNSLPWYYTLCRLANFRLANADLISVRFQHPQTGREITQLVQVRGVQVRITADEWQFRFVTSSVAAWFDVWTLADPSDTLAEAEQSRLSRGHRLATA